MAGGREDRLTAHPDNFSLWEEPGTAERNKKALTGRPVGKGEQVLAAMLRLWRLWSEHVGSHDRDCIMAAFASAVGEPERRCLTILLGRGNRRYYTIEVVIKWVEHISNALQSHGVPPVILLVPSTGVLQPIIYPRPHRASHEPRRDEFQVMLESSLLAVE